jgi:hypothetical protein
MGGWWALKWSTGGAFGLKRREISTRLQSSGKSTSSSALISMSSMVTPMESGGGAVTPAKDPITTRAVTSDAVALRVA